jgi:hypothetical protein
MDKGKNIRSSGIKKEDSPNKFKNHLHGRPLAHSNSKRISHVMIYISAANHFIVFEVEGIRCG